MHDRNRGTHSNTKTNMHIEEQIKEQTVTLRLTAHRGTDRGTNSNTKTIMHIVEQIEEQTVTLRLTCT